MTRIIRVNQINPEVQEIREAAAVIKGGGTVAFPTETVYGIGADAFNSSACRKIFKAKGRPLDNPLIVHISKLEQLDEVATGLDDRFMKAAKVLWPGPVTFILKKKDGVPDEVTASLDTIAVRMPAHPIALRLIDQSNTPIAAPSANISQKPSSTKVSHVIDDLDGKVDMIIDGGDTAFGLESTIVNMTVRPHVLLRPGAFTMEELERFLGKITVPEKLSMMVHEAGTPIAPGMKYRHYSPDKMLIAIGRKELLIEASDKMSRDKKIAVLCSNELAGSVSKNAKIIRLGMESNLYEISKNLFDALRRIDKMDVELALIQTFPERGIGFALMNRIMKASGAKLPVASMEELKEKINASN